jgi:hypothetical protein
MPVDEELHRYELNMAGVISRLEELLSARGYRTVQHGGGDTWVFEARWGRGAAYGEIGSLLYGLVADQLREID